MKEILKILGNITKNCFGNKCHVMDRPYGPCDNQFILQGYQSKNAAPIRSGFTNRKCL